MALLPSEPPASAPRDERLLLTAGVTHELRTPLTILKGRLHGIEDGVISPDGDETAQLLRQVEHVLEIVNDLDMLAQVELGRLRLCRKRVRLADIVGSVVSDLRPLFFKYNIDIIEKYDESTVDIDPVRMTQIVTNLITNAAKHSQTGGRILVDVERRGTELWLSVRDEGPGFAQADQERMFAPFWRSTATVNRPGCPGTGMGLALTARLVEAHGARISAENRTDRSGACFQVILSAA
ncbi:HAMP domain-containing histidine kinase [Sphingobium sp. BYY-5]|uniref:sensor histidine kinase n=1 Tax=Sphingobium sp. BYY-5 TaxID=2926400 RepID=UPI001FA7EF92|nr:HAMP domain-containing sensor histidine kinase [Sphingobium sp. BYY-5]MCI4588933.1 HAMP domain-containing histidine kinase [Sphingobium sp. BYY-5]